jgi:hypothetical protein
MTRKSKGAPRKARKTPLLEKALATGQAADRFITGFQTKAELKDRVAELEEQLKESNRANNILLNDQTPKVIGPMDNFDIREINPKAIIDRFTEEVFAFPEQLSVIMQEVNTKVFQRLSREAEQKNEAAAIARKRFEEVVNTVKSI